ncbi:MAG: hypothetical protein GKR89_35510 [Candidatus Latescibacteria bacterium]|nr:hypothetical protein [Candidatus Latescibacterota bacterium]
MEKIDGELQYRFRFADDIAASVTAEHVEDKLGQRYSDFIDLFCCLLRFCEEAVIEYLEQQNAET